MDQEVKTEQKEQVPVKLAVDYKMIGLLGKKVGMSSFLSQADSRIIPVTLVETGPCVILEVKDYTNKRSIKIGFSEIKESLLKKPKSGYFKKLKITPKRFIKEVIADKDAKFDVGQELKVDIFKNGEFVDISGLSIGKGFQGGMKRWNWHGGPMTHGSMSHRRIGALSSGSTPGRVFKGHHLPGHMGMRNVTTKNLQVISVDLENNLLAVKGAVPGHKNSLVVVKKAKCPKK
ncbi:MAG: 50S ribosomal protein L3 [Candidatus Omnitrophota bacterium]